MAGFRMSLIEGAPLSAAGAGSDTVQSPVVDTRLITLEAVSLKGLFNLSDFKLEYRVGNSPSTLNEYTDQPPLLTDKNALPTGATLDSWQPVAAAAPLARYIQFRVSNLRALGDTVDARLYARDSV